MRLPRTARVALALALALAGAALAATLLVGCGGGLPSGPFIGSAGSDRLCSPVDSANRVFTAGGEAEVKNPGSSALIDRVSLWRFHGLRLLHAWAVQVKGYANAPGGVGDWDGIPAARELGKSVQWRQRRQLDGARVPHTPSALSPNHVRAVNLVFVVKLLGRSGGFDGVDVYYHNRAGHYHLHISNGLTLTRSQNTGSCPLPPQ